MAEAVEKTGAKEAFEGLRAKLEEIAGKIREGAENFREKAGEALEEFKERFAEFKENFGEKFEEFKEQLEEKIAEIMEYLEERKEQRDEDREARDERKIEEIKNNPIKRAFTIKQVSGWIKNLKPEDKNKIMKIAKAIDAFELCDNEFGATLDIDMLKMFAEKVPKTPEMEEVLDLIEYAAGLYPQEDEKEDEEPRPKTDKSKAFKEDEPKVDKSNPTIEKDPKVVLLSQEDDEKQPE